MQSWAVERVKDVDRFLAELVRPIGGTLASAPTQAELEREGQDFVAFAAAFGITPPTAKPEVRAEAV